jgi:hypothetical protein
VREEHLNELDSLFADCFEVGGNNKGRKKRMAQKEIRYGEVRIKGSKNLANKEAYS